MSTFSQKIIDFDISAEHEVKADSLTQNNLPHPVAGVTEKKEVITNAVLPLKNRLIDIGLSIQNYQRKNNSFYFLLLGTQKWFRTRENRNFATVVSTESRIFWFSAFETLLYVFMAVGQVYMIQIFFNKSKSFRV